MSAIFMAILCKLRWRGRLGTARAAALVRGAGKSGVTADPAFAVPICAAGAKDRFETLAETLDGRAIRTTMASALPWFFTNACNAAALEDGPESD
ncbi:hypothetical protein [Burkholderia perseverans]|uniref:hypothetical protein n=1 Tax=Burkholderia perseverans TaxID=2615214 RepID=UPI001FEF5A70|nr:hypothetical protein [Burkholderia perseverans]